MSDTLEMLVITRFPKDHPKHFVVRRHRIQAGGVLSISKRGFLFTTLAEARVFASKHGRVRIDRSEDDDPVIVETWL